MLRQITGLKNTVWLGGKVEYGKWSWSDNSTWEYTNQLDGYSGCVFFIGGELNERPCKDKWPFICQGKKMKKEKEENILKI